ncbi:MAG: type IX secretion system membrane protein PorP/SprF, partial [Flavobacteriales bacterium]
MRKEIKKLLVLGMGLVLLLQAPLTAQQDYLASQYNFNALMLNPAYAGAHSYVQTTAMYRNQWSVEGAPTTQVLCVDGLLEKAPIGLGLMVTTDRIGISKEQTLSA